MSARAPWLLALAALALAPGAAADEAERVQTAAFAALEALEDGRADVALRLLDDARADVDGACVLDELATRAHLALEQLPAARESYYLFTGCMTPTDEPVRAELEAALERAALTWVPPAPPPEPTPPPLPPAPLPEPRSPLGRVLTAGGGAVALGFGATALLTHRRGRQLAAEGEREAFERTRSWNHAAALVAVAGGGVAATGLGLELLGGRVVLAPVGVSGRLP